jgi:anthranilate phosphoribosyltransferase
VLNNLGVQKALVVHGIDGLDEISTIGQTKMTMLKDGNISTSYIGPEDLGVGIVNKRELEGGSPNENASTIFRILHNQSSSARSDPKYEFALVNAAAAIHVEGKTETIIQAMEIARASIESGAAYKKLKSVILFSGGDLSNLEELEDHG